MDSTTGPEPSPDPGRGRRLLTKGQYLDLVGQEAYDRQVQRLHARIRSEESPPAAADQPPGG